MSEKEQLIKLIVQHLNNKGFKEVSEKLEQEANIAIESPELNNLYNSIVNGEFEKAIEIVVKSCKEYERVSIIPKIRICQIFEMIKNEDGKKNPGLILEFIRKIVSIENLYEKDPCIEKCASLVFIQNRQNLLIRMNEICSASVSRETLLDYIRQILQKSTSILRTLYPSSLENMLDSVMQTQIKQCKYHNASQKQNISYFEDHKCKMENIPYKLLCSIEKHNIEVINAAMSTNLNMIAVVLKTNEVAIYQLTQNELKKHHSGDKSNANITDRYTIDIHLLNIFTAHKDMITCLEWNSSESMLLTASKDKTIKVWNPYKTQTPILNFESHENMVTSAIWCDNDTKVCSAGLDHKIMLWSTSGSGNLIESFSTATINELAYSEKYSIILLVAPTTNSILIYDFKKKSEIDKLVMNDTIISIAISKLDKGGMLLVNSSKSAPTLNVWDLKSKKIERKYYGHRQDRLTIRCAFAGENENFLVCGSDDAKINIWSRFHSIPIYTIKCHSGSVNSVIWPCRLFNKILISVSDDHTIKILGNNEVKKVYFYDDTVKLEKKTLMMEDYGGINEEDERELISKSHASRDSEEES